MKTQTELNADTLFAFQMALKGHKQFEYQSSDGNWHKKCTVSNSSPHRIYHDIHEGWTRHDGEDWKGDKDVVIEEVMFCSGRILREERTAEYWSCKYGLNNFTEAESHEDRIYAYKLADKSPEKKVIPWTFEDAPLHPVRVRHKRTGALFASGMLPDCVTLRPDRFTRNAVDITYETLAADYLQLDGSICGKEVGQ